MIKTSVIIVTYNSHDLIEDCINSIFQYSKDFNSIEVIIVDNSPLEGYKKIHRLIRTKFGDKIKIIKNTKNGGYGHGNNLGVANSIGETICIMNPDVRLKNDLIKTAEENFLKNHKLSFVGYKQNGGNNFSFYFRPEYFIPFITTTILTRLFNRINYFNPKFMFLSGALFFIRKKDFIEAGSFDEKIFLYGEESDLIKRLLLRNKVIKFDPLSDYIHLIKQEKSIDPKTLIQLMDSHVHYLKKYGFNVKFYCKKRILESMVKRVFNRVLGKKDQFMIEKEITFNLKQLKKNL